MELAKLRDAQQSQLKQHRAHTGPNTIQARTPSVIQERTCYRLTVTEPKIDMINQTNTPIRVQAISAFKDNYIWCIERRDVDHTTAVVVDPGDAAPVAAYLKSQDLTLSAVLITHHHFDHVNGIKDLMDLMVEPKVIGPAKEHIPHQTQGVQDGEQIHLPELGIYFQALDLPGHTLGHIGFFCEMPFAGAEPMLFCGDTLFSAGCGRLFEGTANQLYNSLQKIAALPKSTNIFCAHEYTQANLAFAAKIEPGNQRQLAYAQRVATMRSNEQPSLPSRLEEELAINPFLRCEHPEIVATVRDWQKDERIAPGSETFAALRALKDNH